MANKREMFALIRLLKRIIRYRQRSQFDIFTINEVLKKFSMGLS